MKPLAPLTRTVAIAVVVGLVAVGGYEAYALSAPKGPLCPSDAALGLKNSSATRASSAAGTSLSAGRPAASPPAGPSSDGAPAPYVINVVAGENFWGSLASQIGGNYTSVISIVTDPNTDPHEYQANSQDAIEFKEAQYVILNNVGYDTWGTDLVAADGDANQTVLNIGDSLGVSVFGGIVTGNPHLWYNPNYVNRTIQWMLHNLSAIEPGLTSYFTEQYRILLSSLNATYSEASRIKAQFAGAEVASTESIFVYLANYTDLDLVSPPAFMEAVAEGNDPSDSSIVTFECQLMSGQIRVLIFNEQTVTPITTMMKSIAAQNNVTIVGVTETVQPTTSTYQEWMLGEYNALYNGLNANALGR